MAAPDLDELTDFLRVYGPIRSGEDIQRACEVLIIDEETLMLTIQNGTHKGFFEVSARGEGTGN